MISSPIHPFTSVASRRVVWGLLLVVVLLAMTAGPMVGPAFATSQEPVQPVGNPDLPQACGIDVALVLDESNSIGGDDDYVEAAVDTFRNALEDTGSRLKIVKFSDDAEGLGGSGSFSDDIGDIVFRDAEDAPSVDLNSGGATNWDDALEVVRRSTDGGGDLTVFVTDGDPTARNEIVGSGQLNPGDGHGDYTWDGDGAATSPAELDEAVREANWLRTDGTHMFGIGVDLPNGTTSLGRLQKVTGPHELGGHGIATADYEVAANFATLQQLVDDYVSELCSATVTVSKAFAEGTTPGGTFPVTLAGGTFSETRTIDKDTTAVFDLPAGGDTTFSLTEDASGVDGYEHVVTHCWDAQQNSVAPDAISVEADDAISCTVTNQGAPALAITKTDSADPVEPGDSYAYTLSVQNTGTAVASNVQVTDDVPADVTVTDVSGTDWDCSATSGNAVDCTLQSALAAGTTAAGIVVDVDVPADHAGGDVVNTAFADADEAEEVSDDETTTVTSIAVLSIVKDDDGASAVAGGGSFEYSIDVTNQGPSTATNVTLDDELPEGLSLVSVDGSDDGWSCNDSDPVVCTLGSLGVDATASVTVEVSVDADVTGDQVVNTAFADADEAEEVSDDETTPVRRDVDLTITKSDDDLVLVAGGDDPGDYTLEVANVGFSDAAAPATVTDILPSPLQVAGDVAAPDGVDCEVDGPEVACTIPANLLPAAGAAIEITIPVVAPATAEAATVTNEAIVGSEEDAPGPCVELVALSRLVNGGDLGGLHDAPNCDDEDTPVERDVDLTVAKSDDDLVLVAGGDPGDYTLTVSNTGVSDVLGDATVVDAVPDELLVEAVTTPDGVTCLTTGQEVSCTVDAALLAAGSEPVTIVVTVSAPASTEAGTVTNTVAVDSEDDPTGCPDGATVCPEDDPEEDSEDTPVVRDGELSVTKTDDVDGTLEFGGASFSYSIVVTNAGPSDVTNVTMQDDLPASVTVTGVTAPAPWTCVLPAEGTPNGLLFCSLDGLAAGTSAPVITVTVAVVEDFSGDVVNTVVVDSDETDPVDDDETTTVDVETRVLPRVIERPAPEPAQPAAAPEVLAATGGQIAQMALVTALLLGLGAALLWRGRPVRGSSRRR